MSFTEKSIDALNRLLTGKLVLKELGMDPGNIALVRGRLHTICPIDGAPAEFFYIDEVSKRWRCEKCDEEGNLIDLYAMALNISFEQAATYLEKILGGGILEQESKDRICVKEKSPAVHSNKYHEESKKLTNQKLSPEYYTKVLVKTLLLQTGANKDIAPVKIINRTELTEYVTTNPINSLCSRFYFPDVSLEEIIAYNSKVYFYGPYYVQFEVFKAKDFVELHEGGFSYDEAEIFIKQNGELKAIHGIVDKKDLNLEEIDVILIDGQEYKPYDILYNFERVCSEARRAYQEFLRVFSLKPDFVKIFTDGGKIVLQIPPTVLNVVPTKYLHEIFYKMTADLFQIQEDDFSIKFRAFKTISAHVYNKLSFCEIPCSLNSKSGGFFIEIKGDELLNLSVNEIKELVKEKRVLKLSSFEYPGSIAAISFFKKHYRKVLEDAREFEELNDFEKDLQLEERTPVRLSSKAETFNKDKETQAINNEEVFQKDLSKVEIQDTSQSMVPEENITEEVIAVIEKQSIDVYEVLNRLDFNEFSPGKFVIILNNSESDAIKDYLLHLMRAKIKCVVLGASSHLRAGEGVVIFRSDKGLPVVLQEFRNYVTSNYIGVINQIVIEDVSLFEYPLNSDRVLLFRKLAVGLKELARATGTCVVLFFDKDVYSVNVLPEKLFFTVDKIVEFDKEI